MTIWRQTLYNYRLYTNFFIVVDIIIITISIISIIVIIAQ